MGAGIIRSVSAIGLATAAVGAVAAAPAQAGAMRPRACSVSYDWGIDSQTSHFMGAAGASFKDGPGGSMTVSVNTASTLSGTVTGTTESQIGFILAKAKLTVSASVTKSVTITKGHQYSHNVSSNKYGHLQYGSWGYSIKWTEYINNGPACLSHVYKRGTATLPVKEVGWRYWETSS
jgi:hypothetical protein